MICPFLCVFCKRVRVGAEAEAEAEAKGRINACMHPTYT